MTESRHATNVTSLRGHARTVLTVPDDMRTLPAIHDAQAGEFAGSSPDSPGYACMETMALASEMIGFD